jgi:hypothetical protein
MTPEPHARSRLVAPSAARWAVLAIGCLLIALVSRLTSRAGSCRIEKVDCPPFPGIENKLHDLVCSGQISLRSAQKKIASDRQALYETVFGIAP